MPQSCHENMRTRCRGESLAGWAEVHFISEQHVASKELGVQFISSLDQTADILSKAFCDLVLWPYLLCKSTRVGLIF